MATLDDIEALLKKLDLRFVKADAETFLLPFGNTKIGRVIVELTPVVKGGWIALRAPIQAALPDSSDAKAALFERALMLNSRMAGAKILFSSGGFEVGYEIDSDKLDTDSLETGIGIILTAVEEMQSRLSGATSGSETTSRNV